MEKHEAFQIISDAILERDWVVGTGKDSAATQIDSVIALLQAEMGGDDEKLVKTMRVCRDGLLGVYRDVERREVACMMLCPCMRGGEHRRWAHYDAGCFTQGCEHGSRLGGRVWDVVEFLRQHNNYENPQLVARVVVGALKTLSEEFRSKEENLERTSRTAIRLSLLDLQSRPPPTCQAKPVYVPRPLKWTVPAPTIIRPKGDHCRCDNGYV